MFLFFFIQVSSWSAWGSCSAPPGRCSTNSGTRKRTRRVTLSPSCGGSSCPTLTHTSQCTPVPIPCKVILIIFFPVSSHLLLVEICPKMHALASNLNNYHILDIASPLAIFCHFRQNLHSQRGHFWHPILFASPLAIFRKCQSVFCTFVIIFDMNRYIKSLRGSFSNDYRSSKTIEMNSRFYGKPKNK